MIRNRIKNILAPSSYIIDSNRIFCCLGKNVSIVQAAEYKFRKSVAIDSGNRCMEKIHNSHSISVMDYEIDRFLSSMPKNALILDIGGCWGWHWRRVGKSRPDIGVVILDFVHDNLLIASQILGSLVNSQIALINADATALPFIKSIEDKDAFDGVWSVQTIQHIPQYEKVYREAYRALKHGGRFVTYSLHTTPLVRLIYRLFRKPFHIDGVVQGKYYLSRANSKQKTLISKIFQGTVTDRYTECLFHPNLKLKFTGRKGQLFGILDAKLGEMPMIGKWIARQRSFEVVKS